VYSTGARGASAGVSADDQGGDEQSLDAHHVRHLGDGDLGQLKGVLDQFFAVTAAIGFLPTLFPESRVLRDGLPDLWQVPAEYQYRRGSSSIR
jgi:hypothetical protein